MTTNSSKEQCEAVLAHVKLLYENKPYFKSAQLAKDDAGLHVEMRVQRSALPEEGAPKLRCVDLVRVCVVVHG